MANAQFIFKLMYFAVQDDVGIQWTVARSDNLHRRDVVNRWLLKKARTKQTAGVGFSEHG